jgi:hypothetical protein
MVHAVGEDYTKLLSYLMAPTKSAMIVNTQQRQLHRIHKSLYEVVVMIPGAFVMIS